MYVADAVRSRPPSRHVDWIGRDCVSHNLWQLSVSKQASRKPAQLRLGISART
jgi:hypothetical protein